MRAVRLPWKVARDLRALVESLPDDLPSDAADRCQAQVAPLVAALDAALKPKRAAAPARKRRTQKAQTRKEKVADIRAMVVERAKGRCECGCGRWAGPAGEMDHMHGGAHKRALESLEGCWLLSTVCHRAKGAALPSRQSWLRAFLWHSERYDYSAEPQRKAEAELNALELQARARP